MATVKNVELGFAEKCTEPWRLLSHYFPSKLGGHPAWLAFNNLPDFEKIKCRSCEKPCKFLLQLYSPGDDENAFHRTLYIFVCTTTGCSDRSFLCFRSQLPQQNSFYSNQPPNESFFDEAAPYPNASDFVKLCEVCNCKGPKTCSQCKTVSYCSREHQVYDWKQGGHKQRCTQTTLKADKEEEMVSSSKSDEEALKEYEKYIRNIKTDKELEANAKPADWQALTEAKVADKAFLRFREKIHSQPDQIIRYDKGGKPVLVSDETAPPTDIPHCGKCNGPREFEFQVMPQTLSYLKLDAGEGSLDWGTLLVYTCRDSCATQDYVDEFVWKQDFSNKDVVETNSRNVDI